MHLGIAELLLILLTCALPVAAIAGVALAIWHFTRPRPPKPPAPPNP